MHKIDSSSALMIANGEIAFQSLKKEGSAADLIIANKERAFQNLEIEKLAEQLLIANKELTYQNKEREKRAEELIVINKKLSAQNKEKAKRTAELSMACKELENSEKHLKEYIRGLEDMMAMISHRVRQPICNILGLASILSTCLDSPVQLKVLISFITQSASDIDAFTKELTAFMINLEEKGKHDYVDGEVVSTPAIDFQ